METGDHGDQMLEPPQPEEVGTASQVEPTPEACNQSDQMWEMPTQKEPQLEEPEVPTSGIGLQVEVDEVKGSEVQTAEYNRECKACQCFIPVFTYA